nr:cohesin domain-containing protein [uncultured Acetatifactor sp.]
MAEPSVGNYEGFEPERKTTFIVNLSRKPEEVLARNGETELHMEEVWDKAAFEAAVPKNGEAVFFYDEAPALMTYASEKESEMNKLTKDVRTTPKLYIRLSEADIRKESQTVEIKGFVSEMLHMEEKENGALEIPALQAVEEKATPTSIWLHWTEVKGASSYEMLVDGRIYSMGNALSYEHDELEYHSEHSYRVRSRNREGYSPWSDEIHACSLLDPWLNEVGALGKITWTGNNEDIDLRYLNDHAFAGLFFSWDDVEKVKPAAIYDFGAVYELEKFDYYPRDTYGNGTAVRMNVYSSLDGVHWKTEWDGTKEEPWSYDTSLELEENARTVPLDGVKARFLKAEAIECKGNKFATHEMPVYKKEGTKGFAVGSTNGNATVTEGDYTNMKNYLGTSVKDGSNFTDQIQKRCGDINMNGIYDVYDYAYTMFHLDDGTTMTGKPEGSIALVPESESVKAGETFTMTVLAKGALNVNAFGKVIDYNPAKLEFVSIEGNDSVKQMENLTVNKVYSDGTAYVNLAFANRGNKKLYNGSDELAVITMKALADVRPAEEMECEGVLLIGPGFDTV